MNSEEAMAKLKEGNLRFVSGNASPKNMVARRAELVGGQKPWATVLSCSDSRVAPVYIFDVNMGEIFTVLNAGNTALDDITLGTLEYGAEHLHTPLIVVMGHEFCGAVGATCDLRGKSEEGHIKKIVETIAGSAQKAHYDKLKCTIQNIRDTAQKIGEKSEIISKLVGEKKLKVVGAYYSISTGKVEFIA